MDILFDEHIDRELVMIQMHLERLYTSSTSVWDSDIISRIGYCARCRDWTLGGTRTVSIIENHSEARSSVSTSTSLVHHGVPTHQTVQHIPYAGAICVRNALRDDARTREALMSLYREQRPQADTYHLNWERSFESSHAMLSYSRRQHSVPSGQFPTRSTSLGIGIISGDSMIISGSRHAETASFSNPIIRASSLSSVQSSPGGEASSESAQLLQGTTPLFGQGLGAKLLQAQLVRHDSRAERDISRGKLCFQVLHLRVPWARELAENLWKVCGVMLEARNNSSRYEGIQDLGLSSVDCALNNPLAPKCLQCTVKSCFSIQLENRQHATPRMSEARSVSTGAIPASSGVPHVHHCLQIISENPRASEIPHVSAESAQSCEASRSESEMPLIRCECSLYPVLTREECDYNYEMERQISRVCGPLVLVRAALAVRYRFLRSMQKECAKNQARIVQLLESLDVDILKEQEYMKSCGSSCNTQVKKLLAHKKDLFPDYLSTDMVQGSGNNTHELVAGSRRDILEPLGYKTGQELGYSRWKKGGATVDSIYIPNESFLVPNAQRMTDLSREDSALAAGLRFRSTGPAMVRADTASLVRSVSLSLRSDAVKFDQKHGSRRRALLCIHASLVPYGQVQPVPSIGLVSRDRKYLVGGSVVEESSLPFLKILLSSLLGLELIYDLKGGKQPAAGPSSLGHPVTGAGVHTILPVVLSNSGSSFDSVRFGSSGCSIAMPDILSNKPTGNIASEACLAQINMHLQARFGIVWSDLFPLILSVARLDVFATRKKLLVSILAACETVAHCVQRLSTKMVSQIIHNETLIAKSLQEICALNIALHLIQPEGMPFRDLSGVEERNGSAQSTQREACCDSDQGSFDAASHGAESDLNIVLDALPPIVRLKYDFIKTLIP